MVGLGLALAQRDTTVIVPTGDGEALMGLGGFATIAVQQPPNLSVIVLDIELYGETGSQRSHTAWSTGLAAVAKAFGIADARQIEQEGELEDLTVYIRCAAPQKMSRPFFSQLAVLGLHLIWAFAALGVLPKRRLRS